MDGRYPVIDSHVHFYDSTRPEGTLWPDARYGLPTRVFPDDLFEAALPSELAGAVLVETGNRRSDDEWLMQIADPDARILGVVANLQPGEDGFEQRLEDFSQFSKLKGIRIRPIRHYDLSCNRLTADLSLLAKYGLSLELGATTRAKLLEYVSLAEKLPDSWCGLTHLGHPKINGEAPGKEWRQAVKRFAALPNTFCKFTSLNQFADQEPGTENPHHYRPVVGFLSEAFGEDRVVYGSNWPGTSIAVNHEASVRLYRKILMHDDTLLEKLLHRNAREIYRL